MKGCIAVLLILDLVGQLELFVFLSKTDVLLQMLVILELC
jgi:hypothetical protein